MDLDEVNDKELLDKLEKAALSERLRNQDEWKLLQEAADRIVDRSIDKFAMMKIDPNNMYEVIELQIIIRKYKHGLFREVDILAQEGEMIFSEARDRDLINK